jgi:hypothetical protein
MVLHGLGMTRKLLYMAGLGKDVLEYVFEGEERRRGGIYPFFVYMCVVLVHMD